MSWRQQVQLLLLKQNSSKSKKNKSLTILYYTDWTIHKTFWLFNYKPINVERKVCGLITNIPKPLTLVSILLDSCTQNRNCTRQDSDTAHQIITLNFNGAIKPSRAEIEKRYCGRKIFHYGDRHYKRAWAYFFLWSQSVAGKFQTGARIYHPPLAVRGLRGELYGWWQCTDFSPEVGSRRGFIVGRKLESREVCKKVGFDFCELFSMLNAKTDLLLCE